MNKTLKKIIIIAIVSVVAYFALIALFCYLDWNLARQYDCLWWRFEHSKVMGVIDEGQYQDVAVPSTMLSLSVVIALISLLLSLIFVFIKRMRSWLYYLIPICAVSGALGYKCMAGGDLFRVKAFDKVYEKTVRKYTRYYMYFETRIYSRWGTKLLNVEGINMIEYRSNNNADEFYLVDIIEERDSQNRPIKYIAKVYDRSIDYVKEFTGVDVDSLKVEIGMALDCYLVE